MSDRTKSLLVSLFVIAAVAALGGFIVYAGTGKLGRSANDAPGWVLFAAGGTFLFAAASMAVSTIGGLLFGASAGADGALNKDAPFALRLAQLLLGLGIVALLALVATWVAFNPESGADTMHRFVFSAGAVSMWLIFCGFACRNWRRL